MTSPSEREEPVVAAPVPIVPTPAVGLHGAVGPFELSKEEWCEYSERLAHYFIANDIVSVEKMRAILLAVVGPATYRLLNTLASPKKLDELRFTDLVDLASNTTTRNRHPSSNASSSTLVLRRRVSRLLCMWPSYGK